jgi:hypothetical protein
MAATLNLLWELSQTHHNLKISLASLIAPSSRRSSVQFPAKQTVEEGLRKEISTDHTCLVREVVTTGRRSTYPGVGQTSIVPADSVPTAQQDTMKPSERELHQEEAVRKAKNQKIIVHTAKTTEAITNSEQLQGSGT